MRNIKAHCFQAEVAELL